MEEIFNINIQAMGSRNPELAKKLMEVTSLKRFEIYNKSGEITLDLNIYDKELGVALYKNPREEVTNMLKKFAPLNNYFYFYLFGIGNGFLPFILLQNNPKLRRLIIIEPELELLAIALHILDFSKDIITGRLQCYASKQLNETLLRNILFEDNSIMSAKLFDIYASTYYENFYMQEFIDITQRFIRSIDYYLLLMGDKIEDTFTGLRQNISFLSQITNYPSLRHLSTKRNSDIAIVVSTGPSLYKQLPLLQQIAPYATLISVDASLPILEEHGIVPDLCVSMERDEPTSAFFQKTSSEFKKEIIFVCATLQHPTVFAALQNKTIVPVFRPHASNKCFKLHDYGYIGKGMSAANMAHDLAYEMGFKKCVLIGQDLSFAPDGATHSKGHIFQSNPSIQEEVEAGNIFEIPAYGLNGSVKTHKYCKAFLDGLQESAQAYSLKMLTINATEGGANIPGTLEVAFETIVKETVQNSTPKTPILISFAKNISAKKDKKRLDQTVENIAAQGCKMSKQISALISELDTFLFTISNAAQEEKNFHLSFEEISKLVNKVDDMRETIINNKVFETFYITQFASVLKNIELSILEISQKTYDNEIVRRIAYLQQYSLLYKEILEMTQKTLEILKLYK